MGSKVDKWKSLVPSPRYSGERVRVRGLQKTVKTQKTTIPESIRKK
jgi:hypothetical protein